MASIPGLGTFTWQGGWRESPSPRSSGPVRPYLALLLRLLLHYWCLPRFQRSDGTLYISLNRARQSWPSGGPWGSLLEIHKVEELEECIMMGVALSLILFIASSRTPSSSLFNPEPIAVARGMEQTIWSCV